METIHIATERGNFAAQRLGTQGDWIVCWPAQLNDFHAVRDFARSLARDFRVVVCDPPGVGLNQSLPYTNAINDLVYYAHQVMAKLGISRCHWVGQSGGGVVGAALYGASPERIQTLTLASTPMLSQGRFSLSVAATTLLLSGSRLGRYLLASQGAKEISSTQEPERTIVTTYLRKVFERIDPKTFTKMRPLDGSSVRRTFERLRANPPPMLILCGLNDRVVFPRDQRTVAEITQAQFVQLRCGHMTLLVEPEACAHAFRRFVVSQPKFQHLLPALAA